MIISDKKNEYLLIFKKGIHKDFEFIINLPNVKYKIINVNSKLLLAQIVLPMILYSNRCDKYLFLAFPSPLLFFSRGLINTVHDMTPWIYPETMSKKGLIYFRILISNAMKRSKLILTVSNSSKKDIKRYFNNNNIEVIYNGVDNRFFNIYDKEIKKDKIKKKYKLPDKYIFSLGTVEPRKNLKLLMDAFVELKQENKINDYKLVLSGRLGWKYNELLQRVKDSDLEKEIIFTGFIDDDDLPYVYSYAECFIFPSIYEGFGIPPLEAMAAGVPIVCSNSSSLPEIVEIDKLMFNSNDIEQLKLKMLEILQLDYFKRSKLISIGINNSLRFNWKRESIKLINLIKHL
jgi:glycosyltransferase involved in cell wall biosynthesis